MSIPASQIVKVLPGVITGGGNALNLNGLVLTQDTAVPVGTVQSFASAAAVEAFFGPGSIEAEAAAIYFNGFENSTKQPGAMLFTQYPGASGVAAYLRGATNSGITLTQVKAVSGTLSLTVDGTVETSASFNLSGSTSYSGAAATIQAAFTAPNFSVSWDSIRGAFKFTSSSLGSGSTITYPTGTAAAPLYLTQATGAVLSQGAVAGVAATFLDGVTLVNRNWGGFDTAWEPAEADKISFALWANNQNKRFVYYMGSSQGAALVTPDTSTAMSTIIADAYDGTCGIYCDPTADPNMLAVPFGMGYMASLDFGAKNGRSTLAFRYQAGLPVSVTDTTKAANLQTNGYNYVGQYATANQNFNFMFPGSVSGVYGKLNKMLQEIFLNSQFELALITLLTTVGSIPYNDAGRALIDAACQDPIDQAINFGTIRQGVSLSAQQAAVVNSAAGTKIDDILSTRGWYLQILDATSQVRQAGGSPPINFWYMDGGDVQQISMSSIMIM